MGRRDTICSFWCMYEVKCYSEPKYFGSVAIIYNWDINVASTKRVYRFLPCY